MIISYGILPYLIGIFGVLSFYDDICKFEIDHLLQINGMIMTLLVIFFGFDVYCRNNDSTRKHQSIYETNAILLISLCIIIISSFL